MDEKQINLYFLGSGQIAVPVLAALAASNKINLVGIGTQQDRPAGRRMMLQATPIGEYAESTGLHVDKIKSVNQPEFLDYLSSLEVEVLLVISFGQILREPILQLPRCGCVNIHSSLLPRYRGAAPISNAILNRDPVTGITFMQMDKGLDTGGVYCSYRYPLSGSEYTGDLETALGRFAAEHVVEVLDRVVSGKIKAVPQNENDVSITRKIKKTDGEIDWNLSAAALEARVRAFHPWPGASFEVRSGERSTVVRITAARILPEVSGRPGEIIQADRRGWVIACGSGALELIRIVPQGRKEMGSVDFLNGFRLDKGALVFGSIGD